MKRILVGCINHESNGFNPIITGLNDFVVYRGEEVLTKGLKPYYSSTGIIETIQKLGWQVVPTIVARAVPNGLVDFDIYTQLKNEFLDYIDKALLKAPIDGICLGLHGSLKVKGLGPAEGDLLKAIRKKLPNIPLTTALDMHATITDDIIAYCNGIVGYKTAPHIDCYETGVHAANLLRYAIEIPNSLRLGCVKIPMLVAGEKSETKAEPMASLINLCIEEEKKEGVLAASILLGFPWADCKENGVTIVTTSLNDKSIAQKSALKIANAFWEARHKFDFKVEHYPSFEAIQKAIDAVVKDGIKPVFVSDSGDNPTAGATGDATECFEALLTQKQKLKNLPTKVLYSGFFDKEAVESCFNAGEGKFVKITIGGVWDTINGKKIPCEVKVLKLIENYGLYSSRLALVEMEDIHILLTSNHIGFGDEKLLPAVDINVEEYCLVIVKLGYLEPCFQAVAKKAILAESKGCSNEILETLHYPLTVRPIYPLDKDMEYTCKVEQ